MGKGMARSRLSIGLRTANGSDKLGALRTSQAIATFLDLSCNNLQKFTILY